MEIILLLIFAISLLSCVFLGKSILIAMIFGYVIFFCYGINKSKTFKEMIHYSLQGVKTVKNILITFILIGILTAVWRASGSIAYIVYNVSYFFTPSIMVLITFLMCALISFLTGTSFGSAATIGVICTTMANTMQVPIEYTAGAVLSGVYFGDRCSPVSTSALLVSELTKTNLYTNIKLMFKSSIVPFVITCILYFLIGLTIDVKDVLDNSNEIFKSYYNLSFATIFPVLIVLIFSALRINVKTTLAVSSICGLLVTAIIQKYPVEGLFNLCVNGFVSGNKELDLLMRGGGIKSMLVVFCIVCISYSYSGMFKGTGFLNKIENIISKLNDKLSSFGTLILTSIIAGSIACNQTLTIMLTEQICSSNNLDKQKFAIDLENTAVVIAPIIPWSIAGAVPLATIDAPTKSILLAFYLFLLPIYNFFIARKIKNNEILLNSSK